MKLTTISCPASGDETVMSILLGLTDTKRSVDFMNKGNLNFDSSGEKDGVFDHFKNNSF